MNGKWAAVLVGVLVLAPVLVVEIALDRPQQVEWYRQVDADSLAITVRSGWLDWTRVTRVDQTSDTIEIGVKSLRLPLPGTGGDTKEITLDLDLPLDDRVVVDTSTGEPIFVRP